MKKILSITLCLILCLCIFALTGCGRYIQIVKNMDGAAEFAKEFCVTLSDEDTEKAKQYLCDEYSVPSKDDFERYILKLETYNEIDFSKGITILSCTKNGWSTVSRKYTYEIICDVLVGEKEIALFFEVSHSENGYEIFSFGVNPKK